MHAVAAITARKGLVADLPSLIDIDQYARDHAERATFIKRSLELGECFIGSAGAGTFGFVVLNYGFFDFGFVPLLVVAARFRRQGLGLRLLLEAEERCKSSKLFTSSSASNKPAQALFAKAGFIQSGVVDNLNDNDPEVLYFKACKRHDG
jgi:ribosomal protein S18 acetylase RimI-like enzyme